MTYPEYIQQIESTWLAAQQRGNVEETGILTAILYRLVHPPEAAVKYLTELAEKTTDAAIRSRYEQAIADIQQCEEAPAMEVQRTPQRTHAEQLAQLFHERYEALAPAYGYETRKASAVPWADVPANNKNLMIAVARDVLATVRAEEQSVRIWQTVTELAGTNQERKQYFMILEDADRPDLRFILQRHADGHIVAEPYVDYEYDYTESDPDEEDEDDNYYPDVSDGNEDE